MRKLATIRRVAEIREIEGADAIEQVRVDGWWVVGKKGEFQVGDLAVYLEIDSWVPHALAPFLSKGKEPREYEGIKGERLRTVRLRGALSQGLLLSLMPVYRDATGTYLMIYSDEAGEYSVTVAEGDDVTELLGIVKYEPPIPAVLGGAARGSFPGWLRKTDQERIQNCFRDVEPMLEEEWVAEEKLDGSSMTVGKRGEEFHICSRNLSLKLEDEHNTFVKVAHNTGATAAIQAYPRNIALSGELCGEGIQGNRYNIKGHKWFIFDIYDVDAGDYVSYDERLAILQDLAELGAKLEQTPLLEYHYVGSLVGMTCAAFLETAEGKSVLNPKAEREGVVYKSAKRPNVSFKAISNKYLIETKG